MSDPDDQRWAAIEEAVAKLEVAADALSMMSAVQQEVVAVLSAAGLDEGVQAVWWTTPSGWLDGAVPLEVLEAGEGDRVLAAARRFAQAGP